MKSETRRGITRGSSIPIKSRTLASGQLLRNKTQPLPPLDQILYVRVHDRPWSIATARSQPMLHREAHLLAVTWQAVYRLKPRTGHNEPLGMNNLRILDRNQCGYGILSTHHFWQRVEAMQTKKPCTEHYKPLAFFMWNDRKGLKGKLCMHLLWR